jgi:hypothetical protein
LTKYKPKLGRIPTLGGAINGNPINWYIDERGNLNVYSNSDSNIVINTGVNAYMTLGVAIYYTEDV